VIDALRWSSGRFGRAEVEPVCTSIRAAETTLKTTNLDDGNCKCAEALESPEHSTRHIPVGRRHTQKFSRNTNEGIMCET
jgi:hypothetical protein